LSVSASHASALLSEHGGACGFGRVRRVPCRATDQRGRRDPLSKETGVRWIVPVLSENHSGWTFKRARVMGFETGATAKPAGVRPAGPKART
jgi:hypothetical protein